MRKFFISVLANTIALVLIDHVTDAVSFSDGLSTVVALAIFITIFNITLKPFLQLVSFPISIITLGLFRFVVNGAVVKFAFDLIDDASIDGIWPAIFVSIALSILSGFIEGVFGEE